jgi:hypothetical protein
MSAVQDPAIVASAQPTSYSGGNSPLAGPAADPAIAAIPPATVQPWLQSSSWGNKDQKPDPVRIAFALRQKKNTLASAEEIMTKIEAPEVPTTTIIAYGEALRALPLDWEFHSQLRLNVTKKLVEAIACIAPAEVNQRTNTFVQTAARMNAATLLGELFRNRYLSGNVHEFCAKLLQNRLSLPSQYEAICKVAEVGSLAGDLLGMKKFCTALCEVTALHEDPQIRKVCADRIRRFVNLLADQLHTLRSSGRVEGALQLPSDLPDDSTKCVETQTGAQANHRGGEHSFHGEEPSESATESESERSQSSEDSHEPSRRRQVPPRGEYNEVRTTRVERRPPEKFRESTERETVRSRVPLDQDPTRLRRTVFIGELTENTSAVSLRKLLDECGELSRIRITRGSTSVMGYVEFMTDEGARAFLKMKEVDGSPIRIFEGKNPISGTDPSDAQFDQDGNIIADNSFGYSGPTTLAGWVRNPGKSQPLRNSTRSSRRDY